MVSSSESTASNILISDCTLDSSTNKVKHSATAVVGVQMENFGIANFIKQDEHLDGHTLIDATLLCLTDYSECVEHLYQ